MPQMPSQVCPCQAQQHQPKQFAECCQPYISGESYPDHPESLMRSRYSAFSLGELSYLLKTWHPETVPDDLEEDGPGHWVRLEVLEVEVDDEDDEAEVEFKARLINGEKLETLHERSVFVKEDGRWLYHSGDFLNDGNHIQKIKKSDPCPCGSNKLFKNCHAKA